MPMAFPSGRWSKRTVTVVTTLAAAAAGAGAAAAMVGTFGEEKTVAPKRVAARHFESFAITNVASGSCVGVAADDEPRGRGSAPRQRLRLAACDGSRNQRWTAGKDGKTLQNLAFPGQCAAAVAQRKNEWTVAMRPCKGNDVHQHWRVWNHYAVDGSAHILEPGRANRAWEISDANGPVHLKKTAKQSGKQQWKFGQAS
ncbi:ricin-type beta-trefoil lectin domain protein [Spirillospora sp. NPDC127200]